MSSNANISSFSYTRFAGISFRLILQNRQSSMRTPRNAELTVESLRLKVFQFVSFVAEIAGLVKPHYECLESVGIPELRGKVLRGVGIWNPAYAHAVKMSVGRIKILDKDGLVAREQALAQALGIGAISKRAHLHGEVSDRGARAGEHLDAHGRCASADHVESYCRRASEVQDSVSDEGAAVDDTNFNLAAVVQVGDAQNTAEWQRAMGGYQCVHIEDFAVGGAAPVEGQAVP